ncbi:MAG: ankyrin repeat domain-containing protein [Rickettsiales bacterium]|jgi:ankyrin repeat protein|nr:ankyrin repeat domain-containing protein [Rickettsiales bacterium]
MRQAAVKKGINKRVFYGKSGLSNQRSLHDCKTESEQNLLNLLNSISHMHDFILTVDNDVGFAKKVERNLRYKDSNNTNLLILAVKQGKVGVVKKLLKAAIRVYKGLRSEFQSFINAQDKTGKTALHYAVYDKNFELVQLLLDFGASYKIYDQHNNTPKFLLKGYARVGICTVSVNSILNNLN